MKTVSKILILNSNDEILMQLRSKKSGLKFANYWTLFGGNIKTGENKNQALQRELKEELNVEIQDIKFLKTLQVTIDDKINLPIEAVYHLFVGWVDEKITDIKSNEGEGLRFFKLEELDNHNIVPFFKEAIISYFKEKKE